MGTLKGISYRTERKGPMHELDTAEVTFDNGVHTDTRGKIKGKRQVTVITTEGWDAACAEINKQAPWTTRRANLLVEGLALQGTTGRNLRIGDMVLTITGELEPCERMDAQVPGMTAALTSDWRGGVTCSIVSEGSIRIGDTVNLE